MKRIELLNLKLRNFKGIRDFTLDTGAADADIFGDNAAGKTTIFDAFTWLLFDKDSSNKKDFEIKTLDAAGNPLHNLEHEVEASLMVGGRRTTLRKVYKEQWTRKRGSATSEFNGHTTDYFIDGVPVKKGEFTEAVGAIVREDVFKLLTSPTFFNEELHWQDRRKKLLEICGDVSDADVIASNEALAKLPHILNGRTIDDHRKVIAAKRADINKELQVIPIRIDEVQRSLPDLEGLNEGELIRQRDILNARLDEKAEELNRIRSGGEIAVKDRRLQEIKGEKLEITNRVQAAALERTSEQRALVSRLRSEAADLLQQKEQKERMIARNVREIEGFKLEADRLRAEWTSENAKTFEYCADENCPTCGQELPAAQVQAAREKAEAAFNQKKADRLAQISAKGKTAAGEARRLEEANVALQIDADTLAGQYAAKLAEFQQAEVALKALEAAVPEAAKEPEYIRLDAEANRILDEIVQLRDQSRQAVEKAEGELSRIRAEISGVQAKLGRFAQMRSANMRMEELAEQEKALAAEYERLEHELYLTEEFIRVKVSLLEDRINSKFKLARFKLFRQQINGGLEKCCETTYNGVPYGSGLNNAARINVGLDIINTLSEHYGIAAPIFVDNAEAVTQLIDTTGQKIRLVVSAGDKKLRVETANKIREAV